jgi:hypothetical protein
MMRVQSARASEGYSVPALGLVQGLVVDCTGGGCGGCGGCGGGSGGGGGGGGTWVGVFEAADDVLVARVFVVANV